MSYWQPIETAPKGGGAERIDDPKWIDPPRILAWSDMRGITIVYWDWYYAPGGNGYEEGRSGWVDWSDAGASLTEADTPTHWMPLPEPPA